MCFTLVWSGLFGVERELLTAWFFAGRAILFQQGSYSRSKTFNRQQFCLLNVSYWLLSISSHGVCTSVVQLPISARKINSPVRAMYATNHVLNRTEDVWSNLIAEPNTPNTYTHQMHTTILTTNWNWSAVDAGLVKITARNLKFQIHAHTSNASNPKTYLN